jgi:hypothetical protein
MSVNQDAPLNSDVMSPGLVSVPTNGGSQVASAQLPEVQISFNRIQYQIGELLDLISVLGKRLQPVLRGLPESAPTSGGGYATTGVEFADSLNKEVVNLMISVEDIRLILTHLEI